jgi:hypothetical protein
MPAMPLYGLHIFSAMPVCAINFACGMPAVGVEDGVARPAADSARPPDCLAPADLHQCAPPMSSLLYKCVHLNTLQT